MDADLSAYLQPKAQYQLPSKFARSKMLFVANGELKMSKARICTQVSHAVIQAFLQIEERAKHEEMSRARLESWEMQGTAKVVVRAEGEK